MSLWPAVTWRCLCRHHCPGLGVVLCCCLSLRHFLMCAFEKVVNTQTAVTRCHLIRAELSLSERVQLPPRLQIAAMGTADPPVSATMRKQRDENISSSSSGCRGICLFLSERQPLIYWRRRYTSQLLQVSLSPFILPSYFYSWYFLFNKLFLMWRVHNKPIGTAETQFPARCSQNTLILWILPQDNTISHVQTLFLLFSCKGNRSLKIGLKSDTQKSQD